MNVVKLSVWIVTVPLKLYSYQVDNGLVINDVVHSKIFLKSSASTLLKFLLMW